jgi:hypothetical protein
MRRGLGRQLAGRRKAAGYLQRELGVLVGYSRTAVANAETGNATIGRQLWENADKVLGTGELFARGYDRIQAQRAAESRPSARSAPVGEGRRDLGVAPLSAPLDWQGYRDRGWPVEEGPGGRMWLVTGTVVDVLEVGRAAGAVAMHWWLYTRGVPDQIRGLPALPDPAAALAVITTGRRCYFLTQSGACPWDHHDTASASAAAGAAAADPGPAVMRWHADGGRVPAPPSPVDTGGRAAWAHAPSVPRELVSPMALLHVLAQAAAATSQGAGLSLPGGVRAVPAAMVPSVEQR